MNIIKVTIETKETVKSLSGYDAILWSAEVTSMESKVYDGGKNPFGKFVWDVTPKNQPVTIDFISSHGFEKHLKASSGNQIWNNKGFYLEERADGFYWGYPVCTVKIEDTIHLKSLFYDITRLKL